MSRLFLCAAIGLVSGCASIKLPELDMLDRAFRDTEVDLEDYPDIGDAPTAPADMRSARDWDKAAQNLISERGTFNAPDLPPMGEQGRTLEEIEALKVQVRAYKLDDPS